MEYQEDWLVLLCSNGILDVFLVLGEQLRVELDVTGLVDAVDVTKAGSNREVWRDWRKSLVDSEDVLWLGVKGVVVYVLIVDTIFLATSDSNLLQSC